MLGEQRREHIRPFDEYYTRFIQVFIPTDIDHLFGVLHAVEIKVKHRQPRVRILMHQTEGRARRIFIRPQACEQSFDRMSLARAQLTTERDHIARLQRGTQLTPLGKCISSCRKDRHDFKSRL